MEKNEPNQNKYDAALAKYNTQLDDTEVAAQVAKIIAEKVNQDDLIRLLETVIDEEMQRPEAEMNCDLIEQCVDALLEMRQDRDHLAVMVPLMQDKAFLHLIQR